MRKLFLILFISLSLQSIGQTPMRMLVKQGTTTITDTDVLDFISRWETAAGSGMPTADKNAFNTFVLGLKSNSLWTKYDGGGDIFPYYGGTAATHAVSLRNHKTPTFIASPTHSSTGVDFNGTTQYVQTGFVPSTDASTTSVHVYYYSGENVSGNNTYFAGSLSGANLLGMRPLNSGVYIFQAYSTTVTASSTTPANYSGGFMLSKNGNNSIFYQRNGTTGDHDVASNTNAATTVQVYQNALNNAGAAQGFNGNQCRLLGFGAGMSTTEATTTNTLIEALQDALGRGVQ